MHRSVTLINNANEIRFEMNKGDYSLLVNEMKRIGMLTDRIPAYSISFSQDCYEIYLNQNGKGGMKNLLDYSFCADLTGDSIDYIGF